MTRRANVRFDPLATCPLWDGVLDRIMASNTALIGYLQRLFGMCLTADISEQGLWMFFGGGANGKSVVADTVTGLMGDYAGEAPPDLLLMRNSPEHPTEIADLCGRRLVVASETDEGRRLRVQLVKRLTGNSRLKARYMRGDYFEFPRTHKLILATNNRPIIKETTLAIWRRIRLCPFEVTIPPEAQDRHLTDKLKAEWPGILNWLLKGCLAWQREGLNEPAEVLAATADYQAEQDPLAEFFDTCCTSGPSVEVPRADLFTSYAAWAGRVKDQHPLDRTNFYERIRRRPGVADAPPRRINGRVTRLFTGIGLLYAEIPGHDM
jgi:putative DNA primase/helicase